MKGKLAALAFVGAIVGGAVLLNLGDAVPVSELRAARVPCDKATLENCPAGIVEQKDFCVCLTNKETVPDEETNLSAARKVRLVVCEINTAEAGKHLVTRYELSSLPLNKDCVTMADDVLLPGVSMHNVNTGIEKKLEVTCAPCKIGPDSWGPCPSCAFRGNCAQLCPAEE